MMKRKETWLVAALAFVVGLGVGSLFSIRAVRQEQDRMSGLVRAVDLMNLSNPLRFLKAGQPDKAKWVLEASLRNALAVAQKQDHPHGAVKTSPDLVRGAAALLERKDIPNEASQAIGASAPQPERAEKR